MNPNAISVRGLGFRVWFYPLKLIHALHVDPTMATPIFLDLSSTLNPKPLDP